MKKFCTVITYVIHTMPPGVPPFMSVDNGGDMNCYFLSFTHISPLDCTFIVTTHKCMCQQLSLDHLTPEFKTLLGTSLNSPILVLFCQGLPSKRTSSEIFSFKAVIVACSMYWPFLCISYNYPGTIPRYCIAPR